MSIFWQRFSAFLLDLYKTSSCMKIKMTLDRWLCRILFGTPNALMEESHQSRCSAIPLTSMIDGNRWSQCLDHKRAVLCLCTRNTLSKAIQDNLCVVIKRYRIIAGPALTLEPLKWLLDRPYMLAMLRYSVISWLHWGMWSDMLIARKSVGTKQSRGFVTRVLVSTPCHPIYL